MEILNSKRDALDLVSTVTYVCVDTKLAQQLSTRLTSLSHLLSFLAQSELILGHEDRKKLHEFEEKCVQVYFHEKSEGLHSSQINRIRATAERLD